MKYLILSLLGTLISTTASADCGAETLDWYSADGKNVCGNQYSGKGSEGITINVSSQTAQEHGSATFRCDKGRWIFIAGSCHANGEASDKQQDKVEELGASAEK